jgi:hypothetical protein
MWKKTLVFIKQLHGLNINLQKPKPQKPAEVKKHIAKKLEVI